MNGEKKQRIIIDKGEKNSMLPAELKSLGCEIEFAHLKVGDYIIGDIAIERKTVNDFISSMINKRILRQLEELQQFTNKFLVIEGIEEQELYNHKEYTGGIHPNAIRGFLLTISLGYKIPIILTQNYEDTAKYLSLIAKKQEKEMPIRANKKSLNLKEQQQYILEGFPGIGPKTAKKLLKEFNSIKGIINSDEETLKKVLGKKTAGFMKIIN